MITDQTNKRFCLSLGEYAKLCIEWHKKDNGNTRYSASTWSCNLEQNNGGYMEHCCNIIKLLSDTGSLEAAGFAVSDEDIFRLGDDVLAEETFADFHGTAAFSLAGRRQRRSLGRVRGWQSCRSLRTTSRTTMIS